MKKITKNPYGPTKDFPGFYEQSVPYQLRCRSLFYEFVFLRYEQAVALNDPGFVEQVKKFK